MNFSCEWQGIMAITPVTGLIWISNLRSKKQLTNNSNWTGVLLYKKGDENCQKHLLPGTSTAVP